MASRNLSALRNRTVVPGIGSPGPYVSPPPIVPTGAADGSLAQPWAAAGPQMPLPAAAATPLTAENTGSTIGGDPGIGGDFGSGMADMPAVPNVSIPGGGGGASGGGGGSAPKPATTNPAQKAALQLLRNNPAERAKLTLTRSQAIARAKQDYQNSLKGRTNYGMLGPGGVSNKF